MGIKGLDKSISVQLKQLDAVDIGTDKPQVVEEEGLNDSGDSDSDKDQDKANLLENLGFGMLVNPYSEQYDEKILDCGTGQELRSSPSNTLRVVFGS